MARIDYDEDDVEEGGTPDPRWRRLLATLVLATIGLGLGFLIPYSFYLNHEVGQRFDQLRWQLPTRVYGRPLALVPDLAMDADTLEVELRASGYHPGNGVRPGTYDRDDADWKISSRGFDDVDGPVAPRMVQLTLSGGRVSKLEATGGKDAPTQLRLDPARIATLYGQKQEERRLVQLDEVPELLVTGLQAMEDRDFASHHGIDLSGIVRAAWINLRSGEARQGASTLTQQLARSGLLGIGREQTFTRKFNEIIYALLIEARYDKRLILEAYFNQVYMGQRGARAIHGMAAASEFWFGRDLADLKPEQVALLIGIVRGPSYYDPRRHPERAIERRNLVLDQMFASTLLDADEHERAREAPLGISNDPGRSSANRFPAYVDLVRRQLARDYSSEALAGAGLTVMTAMAPSAQAYAEGAVIKTLKGLEGKDRPDLQAGVVLTDVHHGDVLAVVGSGTPVQPGFNRAIEAHRPVGSLLKPFVYLLALATPGQWSLASWVDDSPVTVTLANGKRWTPGNSDGRSHGSVRLIDALARSYNQATVRVGMQVAPRRIAELVHTLAGIKAEPNPALILGSIDQSPYAMAQLYQFLASGGEIQPLHAVRGVLDTEGKALNRYDDRPDAAQDGDGVAARLVTIALQRAVSSGTGRQLVADGLGHLQAAGKTGTSNDGRDSWFAGYTGDHLAVAWIGNDQNQSTGLYGATGGMRVWSNLFQHLPSAPLKVGDKGIDWQWVSGSNVTDASCPGATRFAFADGFAPPYRSCRPTSPELPASEQRSGDNDAGRGGWREWFGFGRDRNDAAPPPSPEPQETQ